MARGLSYNPLLKSYPDSDKINAVSEGAEVLYTRLIAQSDDYGRYYGEPRFVLAKLFTSRMLTGEVTEDSIKGRLMELFVVDLVRFYEVAGVRYLQMVDVHKRLRNDVSRNARFPAPSSEPARCNGQHVPTTKSATSRECPADGPDTSRECPADGEPATATATNPTTAAATATSSLPETNSVRGAILTFPCDGPHREWPLTAPILQDLCELFPSVDVLAECRKALAWVKAKPDRKKTSRGMRAFLTGWLTRELDKRNQYANRSRHETGARAGYDPHAKGDI